MNAKDKFVVTSDKNILSCPMTLYFQGGYSSGL